MLSEEIKLEANTQFLKYLYPNTLFGFMNVDKKTVDEVYAG